MRYPYIFSCTAHLFVYAVTPSRQACVHFAELGLNETKKKTRGRALHETLRPTNSIHKLFESDYTAVRFTYTK